MKRSHLFVIIVLLLILIGLLVYLCFFKQPETDSHAEQDLELPPPSGADPAPSQQTDALATEELQSGLIAEVVRVNRASDGLVEVRWRYRNPTEQLINLCSNDEGKALVAGLYCTSGGEKHTPAEISDGRRLASDIGWTDVPPGQSVLFWARFDVPAGSPHVAFFVPGLLLPMEDLAVAEQASIAEPQDGVLATEPHITGLIVEVLRVRRTKEDLVEVRWRYRNQSDEGVHLFDSGQAEALPSRICLIDDATRIEYLVHRDDEGVPTASSVAFTNVPPGKSVTFFARFPALPDRSMYATFYVPDTPPLAKLMIERKSSQVD